MFLNGAGYARVPKIKDLTDGQARLSNDSENPYTKFNRRNVANRPVYVLVNKHPLNLLSSFSKCEFHNFFKQIS